MGYRTVCRAGKTFRKRKYFAKSFNKCFKIGKYLDKTPKKANVTNVSTAFSLVLLLYPFVRGKKSKLPFVLDIIHKQCSLATHHIVNICFWCERQMHKAIYKVKAYVCKSIFKHKCGDKHQIFSSSFIAWAGQWWPLISHGQALLWIILLYFLSIKQFLLCCSTQW